MFTSKVNRRSYSKLSLAFFVAILLFSCTKEQDTLHSDDNIIFHPIHLRVENVTNLDFTSVQVGGQNLENYGFIAAGDTSLYQYRPDGGYHYSYVKVKTTVNDSFLIQPFDYVGETPLSTGYYTYRLYFDIYQNGSEADTTLRIAFQVD